MSDTNRDARIEFRTRPDTKDRIEKAAAEEGVSVAAYVRQSVKRRLEEDGSD